ncbi:MAG: oligogalacturonate lyase family protein [Coriobacteriia bacterium]|nr:oligogalacturonate lyase family protein [Coriobacteriia bacterium]
MAIGDLTHNSFVRTFDPDTGAMVERLTSPSATCHLPRPGIRATSRDGKVLLYVGTSGEARQLFALNLDTGVSVQLTSGKGLLEYEGVCLDPDDRHAFYVQRDTLWRIDLTTLLLERLYTCDDGWALRWLTVSADGRYAVTTEIERTSVPANIEQPDWSLFELSTIAAPRSRIVLHSLGDGASEIVLEDRCWLGRATLQPGGQGSILYCHEGAYDYIDARMWLVSADGSRLRCAREKSSGEIAIGETWLDEGRSIGYLHRVGSADPQKLGSVDWSATDLESIALAEAAGAATVRRIDARTFEEEVLLACHPYAHLAFSPNGRYCTGDGANGPVPLHLVADAPAAGVGSDEFIYLCDLETRREVRLCRHATSWSHRFGTTQDTHPHPSFSTDGNWVYFVSDREGHPAIYRVDVARFLRERDGGNGPVGRGEEGAPDASWGFSATYATGESPC